MKKILFLLLLLALPHLTFAQDIHKTNNYSQAINIAVEKNKPLLIVMSSKNCPWCKKLERQTLSNKKIQKYISENFIMVSLDRDDSIFPPKFQPKVVPTVYFVDPHGAKKIDVSYGYKDQDDFMIILKNLQDIYRK